MHSHRLNSNETKSPERGWRVYVCTLYTQRPTATVAAAVAAHRVSRPSERARIMQALFRFLRGLRIWVGPRVVIVYYGLSALVYICVSERAARVCRRATSLPLSFWRASEGTAYIEASICVCVCLALLARPSSSFSLALCWELIDAILREREKGFLAECGMWEVLHFCRCVNGMGREV